MSAWDPIDASAPQVCFVSFQYEYEYYLICYMCLFLQAKNPVIREVHMDGLAVSNQFLYTRLFFFQNVLYACP
jgi:hypothetical protein